jgi:DNA-binding transcriptional ArsR family regulator
MRPAAPVPAPADDSAELQAKFFHGLSHPVRLRIILHLLDGSKNVGDLMRLLGLQQAHVSNHLACLKWCGFVTARQQGRRVYYAVVDPRVREIVHLGRAVVADNAARIAACTRM